MNINYNENTIVFKLDNNSKFVVINTEWRILSFSINNHYVVVSEDWEHLTSNQNTTIYNSKGDFLFKLDCAPRALYKDFGYYTSVNLKSENILVVQNADFRYEYDLEQRKFIKEEFTK